MKDEEDIMKSADSKYVLVQTQTGTQDMNDMFTMMKSGHVDIQSSSPQ